MSTLLLIKDDTRLEVRLVEANKGSGFGALEIQSDNSTARLLLDKPITIDSKLLKPYAGGSDDPQVLKSWQEIVASVAESEARELEAARTSLRASLAQPLRLAMKGTAGGSFFGVQSVAGADLEGELRLPPDILDKAPANQSGEIVARAAAQVKLNADWNDGGATSKHEGLDAAVAVVVTISVKGLMSKLDLELPKSLPGFDLALPSFPLPKLDFGNFAPLALDKLMPSLGGFTSVPFLQDSKMTWGTAPKLEITATDGKLAFAVTGGTSGTLSIAGKNVLFIDQFELHGGSPFQLSAKLRAAAKDVTLPARTIDAGPLRVDTGPVVLHFEPISVSDQQPLTLPIRIKLDELLVSSANDPLLTLPLKVEVLVTAKGRQVKTSVSVLTVRPPYPINLLEALANGARDFLGETIRLAGALELHAAMPALLRRLADMLGAALRWLGDGFAEAGRIIAGVGESVVALLERLFRQLAGLLPDGPAVPFSHLALEARLDARTWALRQVLVSPALDNASSLAYEQVSALGLDFAYLRKVRPSLVVDLPNQWAGLAVQLEPGTELLQVGTDLWLDKSSGPAEPVTSLDPATGQAQQSPVASGKQEIPDSKRLLSAKVATLAGAPSLMVLFAVQRGELKCFQRVQGGSMPEPVWIGNIEVRTVGEGGDLEPVGWDGFDIKPAVDGGLKDRLLNLLPKAEPGKSGDSMGFLDSLSQYVKVSDTPKAEFKDGHIEVEIPVEIKIAGQPIATDFKVSLDLLRWTVKLADADKLEIRRAGTTPFNLLGLHGEVKPKDKNSNNDPFVAFLLDLTGGKQSLGLGDDAHAELTFGDVSTSGRGMVFDVDEFAVASDGLTLGATISPAPVILGGVDVPFRFTSGSLKVRQSRFLGASLAGSGQLPRALIGEANANIALSLAADGNAIVIDSAEARLDKSGDPIVCESTRFRLTLTELGLGFVREQAYHFYFQLTGQARFTPNAGEAASGLLKHLGQLEIQLNKTPLTSDPRVLMRSISFQVKCEPPKRGSFFDIFDFELRGFGFHPSTTAFNGDPAISVSGQVKFAFGDVPSLAIDCHQFYITAPKPPSSFPRLRFDGLTVGLQLGGMARVEGTALAVDDQLPDLFKPGTLPANVTANGFLAAGRIELQGWAPMSANMGFLELRKDGKAPRHAFYFYAQRNKLAEKIPTPVGNLYLREMGFGFGYRYTLASIAQAEKAESTGELIRILDEVSKYQGSLDQIRAWQPTYDNAGLTLAMRALFTVASTSTSDSYEAESEAQLPNPLLFDVIAAIRSDLTLFMNVRAWLAVNYADWLAAGEAGTLRNSPTQRGYLYLSAPRREFLGRFISDGQGVVGEHPKLPQPLVDAIRGTRFSATLYIRPGLFHFELGWPYELATRYGDGKNFQIDCQGGLIHRIEDSGMLMGLAFRATGWARFSGRVGGDSLGASASAQANFALEAKLLSYLSLRSPGDTMLYGSLQLNVTVAVSVEVWLRFKVWRFTVSLRAGFSLSLSLSIGVELALFGSLEIGGRAHVAIGVQAFGRSLSLGIGFQFGQSALENARARVVRFMELGLTASVPSSDPTQPPQRQEQPAVEASRGDRAVLSDQRLEEEARQPAPPPVPVAQQDKQPDEPREVGEAIACTHFWALLFPTAPDDDGKRRYVMQLVPRDQTPMGALKVSTSTFFASPQVTENPDRSLSYKRTPAAHLLFGKGTNPLPAFKQLWADGTTKAVADTAGALEMDLEAVAIKNPDSSDPAGDVHLGDLMTELFLGLSGDKMTEPNSPPPLAGREALGPDAQANAERLTRAGRARRAMTRADKQGAEVQERRAAVLGAVVETAEALAVHGPSTPDNWPMATSDRLDCRHFGLTFLVTEDDLPNLFNNPFGATETPPEALFGIKKWEVDELGEVHLFNPPRRHFAQRAPRLAGITQKRSASGVMLDWDLEPAWGASASAYDDPEFHLRHYVIVRTISGLREGEWRASFQVKGAASIEHVEHVQADGKLQRQQRLLRPPMQFVDDFSQPAGLPEELRQLLCGRIGKDAAETWVRYSGSDQLTVSYLVIPVDIAGTCDAGTPIDIAIPSPVVFMDAPVAPKLSVIYPGTPLLGWPDDGHRPKRQVQTDKTSGDARLALGLELSLPAEPEGVFYRLRLRPEAAAPGGLFGDEAVQAARAQPDQAEMDAERSGDREFILTPVADAGSVPLHLVLPEGAERKHPDWFVTILAVDGAPTARGTPHDGAALLLEALGAEVTSTGGQIDAVRAFLCAEFLPPADKADQAPDGAELTATKKPRPSAWQSVAFGTCIRGVHAAQPAKQGQSAKPARLTHPKLPPVVDATVECFEAVRAVEFQCLHRGDMAVETGQLAVLGPDPDKDLGQTVGDTPTLALTSQRDVRRRVATRLRWRARPRRLVLADGRPAPDDFWKLIGGFDLFSVDPDLLPADFEPLQMHQNSERFARSLGRVTLLPASMRGLAPDGFGDLGKIETCYPSHAWRMRHAGGRGTDGAAPPAGANQPRLAPWFSTAESVPSFPKPMLRRSPFAAPDDALIAALYARGRPGGLRVRMEGWPFAAHPPVVKLGAWQKTKVPAEFEFIGKITPAILRQQLQDLVLVYDDKAEFVANWQSAALRSPGTFAGIRMVLEALAVGTDPRVLATETVPFNPLTALHPALEDALALMAYPFEVEGPLYRRYEVVQENAPTPDVTSFAAFLDQLPPERDPYGWASLRLLGLATAFKLYDTETGDYLLGSHLLRQVRHSFGKALERYRHAPRDEPGDLAAPFVDLVTRPWGNAILNWLDGGVADPDQTTQRAVLNNELLSTVQLALRPLPQALTRESLPTLAPRPRLPVTYLTLRLKKGVTALEMSVPVVGEKDAWPALYDVVEVDGFAQARPRRIEGTGNAPVTIEFGPRASSAPRRIVIRIAALADPGKVEVMPALKGGKGRRLVESPLGRDCHALPFGLFDDLSPEEWLRVLVGSGDAAKGSLATLEYYAARRFGPVAQPATDEEATRTVERYLGFWRCFLLHGEVRQQRDAGSIPFSFGTLADPGVWRQAVAPDGSLSAVMVEAERFGARRRYAVRPHGRFESLAARTPSVFVDGKLYLYTPPRALDRGLPEDWDGWNDRFVDGTLPRTEPVAKPVVLGSRLRAEAQALELIVAHTPDQTLAHANRGMRARVAQHGIGVAFFREFAHPQWAAALLSNYDGLARFGSLDARVDDSVLDVRIGNDNGNEDLSLMRDDIPDAWMGAWVIRARQMPYFFRMHALVHASAGVMVSEPTVATFQEGFSTLRLPWTGTGSNPPGYSVRRVNGRVCIDFAVPAVRFIDCMHPQDRTLWFGKELQHLGKLDAIVHLPEPGTGYRIGLQSQQRSGETAAWQPELELLPTPPALPAAGVYSVMSIGSTLKVTTPAAPPSEALPVTTLKPKADNDKRRWSTTVEAVLSTPSTVAAPEIPVSVDIGNLPADWRKSMAGLVLQPVQPYTPTPLPWWRFAPAETLSVTVPKPVAAGSIPGWPTLGQRCKEVLDQLDAWGAQGLEAVRQAKRWVENLQAIAEDANPDVAWKDAFGATDPASVSIPDWKAGLPRDIWTPLAAVDLSGAGLAWPNAAGGAGAEERQAVMKTLAVLPSGQDTDRLLAEVHRVMRQAFHCATQRPLEAGFAGIQPRRLVLDKVQQPLAQAYRAHSERRPEVVGLLYAPLRVNWPQNSTLGTRDRLAAVDAVLALLEGRPGAGPAIESLSDWAASPSSPSSGAPWMLPIVPPQSMRDTLTTLGITLDPLLAEGADPAVVVLWLPPEDEELAAVDKTDEAGAVHDRLVQLAADQLFGSNRRLAVMVVRGSELPQVTPFQRR